MARDVEARLRISAVDNTRPGINSVIAKMRQVERVTQATNRAAARHTEATRRITAVSRATAAVEASASASMIGMSARVIGPAALGFGAASALKNFASAERAVERIGITAGASASETQSAFRTIEQASYDYAMAQGEIIGGLDTLVAQGRSMEEAMSFLPSVTATAQASGSAINDIALTADSVGRNFGIAGNRMQEAFDIMVAGGKAGMFELKDMAQYLPSIAPAFTALGYEGEEGLKKFVAMLQQIRVGAGESSQAASYAMNIFSKMESEETANKFEKFGVDLRAEMARARREGRDLIDFFVELSEKTVGGDLSRLPQLFSDMEMAAGMRSMIRNGEVFTRVMVDLGHATGTTARDLDRVLEGTQTKLDRLSSNWTSLVKNMGEGVAVVANPLMERLNSDADDYRAFKDAVAKETASGGSESEASAEYYRRYEQANPKPDMLSDPMTLLAWRRDRISSFYEDGAAYGRGEIDNWYGNLDREAANRKVFANHDLAEQYGLYGQGRAAAEAAMRGGPSGNIDNLTELRTGVPKPMGRDSSGSYGGLDLADQYEAYFEGRRAGEDLRRQTHGVIDAGGLSGMNAQLREERLAAAAEGRLDDGRSIFDAKMADYAARSSANAPWLSAPSLGVRIGPFTGDDESNAAADDQWQRELDASTDALRLAMEDGGMKITDAGTDAGMAISTAGQEASATMVAAVTSMATAIETAIRSGGTGLAASITSALAKGVRVDAPSGGGVNANLGRSMPNVGTPGL